MSNIMTSKAKEKDFAAIQQNLLFIAWKYYLLLIITA